MMPVICFMCAIRLTNAFCLQFTETVELNVIYCFYLFVHGVGNITLKYFNLFSAVCPYRPDNCPRNSLYMQRTESDCLFTGMIPMVMVIVINIITDSM